MPFQKGNKLAKKPYTTRPLGKVIGVRAYKGQLEAIAQIPEWQEKIRQYMDRLIEEYAIAPKNSQNEQNSQNTHTDEKELYEVKEKTIVLR